MTFMEQRIGEIFDQAQGCYCAPSGGITLWCYWPNSTKHPCLHCYQTMSALKSFVREVLASEDVRPLRAPEAAE